MTRKEALTWFEEELKNGKCSEDCSQCNAMEWAIKALKKEPIVHAHWTSKRTIMHDGETYCSECGCNAGAQYGRYTYELSDYCPNCGAKMDTKGNRQNG